MNRKILDLNIEFNTDTKNFEMTVLTVNKKGVHATKTNIDYSIIMKFVKILEDIANEKEEEKNG